MTDFFTRLAERTLGIAPLAQPAIAPLFAPNPPMMPHVFPLTRGGETQPETVFSGDDSYNSPRASTLLPPSPLGPVFWNPGQETDRGLETQPETRASNGQDPTRQPTQGVDSPKASPQTRPKGSPEDSRENSPRSLHHRVAANLPLPTIHASPLGIFPNPSSPSALQTSPTPSPLVPLSSQEQLPQPWQDRRLNPSNAPVLVKGTATPRHTESSPLVSLLPSRAESPPELSAPPPIIRVNIGRIEVRAVSAPPRPQPPAPPQPHLSLEDYLANPNRSGGSR